MDDLLVSGQSGVHECTSCLVMPAAARPRASNRAAVPYSPGMPIYRLGALVPAVHPEAFIHPEAVVIGDVTVGAESTVWPGAVLRGDYGSCLLYTSDAADDLL